MERLTEGEAIRRWTRARRAEGKRVGFVPTMGNLHAGHLSLVALAREHADVVVASIYVNPTQFDRKDDLAAYPRTLEADAALLEGAGVDALFAPANLYPYGEEAHTTWVDVDELTKELCGATRPGHFRGVTTVVAKLFHLVEPDVAVFGDKDFQQRRVIERMVRDLDFGIAIVPGPIVREADGLAMSSRNSRLGADARARAVAISRALGEARAAVSAGERDGRALEGAVRAMIEAAGGRVDYVELVDEETLSPAAELVAPSILAVAAFFDGVRLIDNARLAP